MRRLVQVRRLAAAGLRGVFSCGNALRLVVTLAANRRVVELWVGDSHAQSHNRRRTNTKLSRCGDIYIWYLGPRLLWSISRKGFPSRLMGFSRFLGAAPRRGRLVLCVILGEIDVRAHLAVRPEAERHEFAFVSSYVGKVNELGDAMKAHRSYVVVPPPPTRSGAPNPAWPVRGDFADRLDQFTRLRTALTQAVEAVEAPQLGLLDPTSELMDPTGSLASGMTEDQVHLNARGIAVIRRRMKLTRQA